VDTRAHCRANAGALGKQELGSKQGIAIERQRWVLDVEAKRSRRVTVARTANSPMTSAATPVSAAAEQEHHHNDNQDQFHGISPLMATALFAAYPNIQRQL
jgi:hypothetical protein